jgi:hypothetical protein
MKRAACRKASVAGAAKGNRGIVIFCEIEVEEKENGVGDGGRNGHEAGGGE